MFHFLGVVCVCVSEQKKMATAKSKNEIEIIKVADSHQVPTILNALKAALTKAEVSEGELIGIEGKLWDELRPHDPLTAMGELFSDTCTLKCTFRKKEHDYVSSSEAEALDMTIRQRAIAVRGTGLMAVPSECFVVELMIILSDGAYLLVKNSTHGTYYIFTSDAQRKKHCHSFDRAFYLNPLLGEVMNARTVVAPEVLGPEKRGGLYLLPTWLASLFARFAESVLRIQVLATACVPEASRALYVDHGTVSLGDKLIVKLHLHTASQGCLCHLRNCRSTTQYNGTYLRIAICGRSTKASGCIMHDFGRPTDCKTFSYVCAEELEVELVCNHEGTRQGSKFSIAKQMKHEYQHNFLREIMSAAATLIDENTPAECLKTKTKADDLYDVFVRAQIEAQHDEAQWAVGDAIACYLLRRNDVRISETGTLKSSGKLTARYKKIAATHGGLFKKERR